MADISAIGAFIPTLDRFPILRSVDSKRWDKVLAIAAIFVAVSRLNQMNMAAADRESILDVVTKFALQWDSRSIDALDDCRTFVDRTYDAMARDHPSGADRRFLFSDALGGWIIWNLFDHGPENDVEWQLVRVLGSSVVHEFYSWWEG